MADKVPYASVCALIFKEDLLPSVHRWISALSPEELSRFSAVFPRIAADLSQPTARPENDPSDIQTPNSNYTMPEWRFFRGDREGTKIDLRPEALLARATSSHLTYGAFDDEQMRACRAVPTRSRESDKSQINTSQQSPAYMARWSDRMMNTTYRGDICRSGFNRTVKDQTIDQQIQVFSKGTLNEKAAEAAKKFVETDPGWTRAFRELCRSLADSIDATAYRASFTSVKKGKLPQFTHPKWSDPVPVSVGLSKPAEAFWTTTHRRDFAPVKAAEETFKVVDQHNACYSRPFDLHPQTEKVSTTVREGYLNHMATKDDHPEYFMDMQVRVPAGSGVVGDVIGRKE
jgi:hypothetical protein